MVRREERGDGGARIRQTSAAAAASDDDDDDIAAAAAGSRRNSSRLDRVGGGGDVFLPSLFPSFLPLTAASHLLSTKPRQPDNVLKASFLCQQLVRDFNSRKV